MKKGFREEHTRSVAFLNYKLHDCASEAKQFCTIAPLFFCQFARLRQRNTTVLHDCAVKNCMASTIAPHAPDIGTASSKIWCQINITHFITNFITHPDVFITQNIYPIERSRFNNRILSKIINAWSDPSLTGINICGAVNNEKAISRRAYQVGCIVTLSSEIVKASNLFQKENQLITCFPYLNDRCVPDIEFYYASNDYWQRIYFCSTENFQKYLYVLSEIHTK